MEGNSKIIVIFNQYKDILDDLIDRWDLESPDWAGPIDKRSRNAPISEDSSADLSEKNGLDEDFLDRVSRLAPKTEDSQIREYRAIAP